ncbi:unnamed protein product [Caenorhabditis angaria]|uniref:Uncharacterized protein n=1 Tax=Caenorhabditis angaria TaxID=860376 RepID=A0A9P1MWG4_9PELO|nr:unnamed protein product [Caenorhabditis angaria]
MEDFRNRILQAIRDVMNRENQSESGLQSWNGSGTKGFEMIFESVQKSGIPVESGIVGQIFITKEGGFEVFLNIYIIKDNLRSIVKSVSFPDSSNIRNQIAETLSPLILSIANVKTLAHLLMFPLIRDTLLSYLNGKDGTKLAFSNKPIREIVLSRDCDNRFWRKHLKKEFGAEKLQEATSIGRSFYRQYQTQKAEAHRNANTSRGLGRSLLVENPRNPLLIGEYHQPRRPFDPDTEYFQDDFDPLNPIRNPRLPPGDNRPGVINPIFGQNPRRGGNADLDPFGDPLRREMFGPPRGGFGGGGNRFL